MAELVVEVKNLSVRFGDFFAVKDVSFSVGKGEIFGFLGANGAGKTTTIRVLCGLLKPTEGDVRVAGLGFEHGMQAIKSKVGYMSQRFTLYEDLTVAENLLFASQLRKIPFEEFEKRKSELLQFISFDRSHDILVKDLPGGIKQQISLVAALLHRPEIVFLDEPTAGVTPAFRARFWSLIEALAQAGSTVFVTTHYMDEAEHCGRIALMRSGELIALDSPQELKKQTFPRGLLELEPIEGALRQKVLDAGNRLDLSLFEAYGMRFHAEVAASANEDTVKKELSQTFHLRSIAPTLEDVFIRLVEGGSR